MQTIYNRAFVAFLVSGGLTNCIAQIDWLTTSESEELIELHPLFKSSQARGECPGFVRLGPEVQRKISLQLRQFCLPDEVFGSGMIQNLDVDRATGAVMIWQSEKSLDESEQTKNLRRTLVAEARARALTVQDATCVAREVVRRQWGPDANLELLRRPAAKENEVEFSVQYLLLKPRALVPGRISIDTRFLSVRERSGGTLIHSLDVDELFSRMREVREPPYLSKFDVIRIVSEIPSFTADISRRCAVELSADEGTAHKRFITIEDTCDKYPRSSRVIAAVDLRTGMVTDPRSQKIMDNELSVSLAKELLSAHINRREDSKVKIEHTCHEK
jgi:hypothetical protein